MNAPARAVALVPHRDRPHAHDLARTTADWLVERGIEVRVPHDLAEPAGLHEFAVGDDALVAGLDLAMSFGGDGTMLHTVHLVYPAPVPIVGVNVGQLA